MALCLVAASGVGAPRVELCLGASRLGAGRWPLASALGAGPLAARLEPWTLAGGGAVRKLRMEIRKWNNR